MSLRHTDLSTYNLTSKVRCPIYSYHSLGTLYFAAYPILGSEETAIRDTMGKVKVEDQFFNYFAASEPLLTAPNMESPGLDSLGDFVRTPLELSPSPEILYDFKASASYVAERHRYHDAEPGELWLSAKKNEVPWPVVICDEEMLQVLLKGRDRPVNARQEDGTWRNRYGPGGHLADQRCFPTMRLGSTVL